ncbi:hypothetical protein [Calothrix sp. UHCC 0171]|uniref:hypothetical protein n=1 Tax=Calothrix sp. UHCC 0171 TaxID=3110245 RepID=UPI002B2212CF|nr:hypothetical protein [Calothrix sp. UHCC 0171]MEA5572521.1 hypothetical protein [Calothrix sp. UHCC 0171]
MLKKSLALGVLAALAMAPAAFADQVQGNVTNTSIGASNFGSGNVTGITNSTGTNQSQAKFGGRWCRTSGNQVQGNATNTGISAGNVGVGNVTGISNSTGTNQSQVAGSGCYFRY